MRITRLQAENFKRLEAVDITPGDGAAVVIGGRNAQGKTSVLDAIMATVAGRKGSKELTRPIRDGESKARVALEIGDLVVERKWTPSGSEVTVKPKGGASKINSPQKVLDGLIGALAFDPLEFAESDPKAQVETLIDIVGREPFEQIATHRRASYEARTEVNRDLKRAEAQYAAVEDASEPVEAVDVSALVEHRERVAQKVRLRERWQGLEDQILEMREEQATLANAASSLPDGDVAALDAGLAKVGETNRAAGRHGEWVDLGRTVEDARHAADTLTQEIADLDEARGLLVRGANLPVPGLTFNDEGVLLNGVPFGQSSAAERLKVSVAMAMAMNPELRVICVRDASLLDDDSKRALVAMATERDYQIWLEVVGDAGDVGVTIEDGKVQA